MAFVAPIVHPDWSVLMIPTTGVILSVAEPIVLESVWTNHRHLRGVSAMRIVLRMASSAEMFGTVLRENVWIINRKAGAAVDSFHPGLSSAVHLG